MNSKSILAVSIGTLTLASLASSFQDRVPSGSCCPLLALQQSSRTQKATILVNNGEYSPAVIKAHKGVPLELTFKLGKKPGCGIVLLVPEYKIRKDLKPGMANIVTITPKRTGTTPFTCGMGMLRGKIVVS